MCVGGLELSVEKVENTNSFKPQFLPTLHLEAQMWLAETEFVWEVLHSLQTS